MALPVNTCVYSYNCSPLIYCENCHNNTYIIQLNVLIFAVLSITIHITGTKATAEILQTIVETVNKYKKGEIDDPNDERDVWKAVEQLFTRFETSDAPIESVQREPTSLNIKCRTLTGLQNVLTLFKKDGQSFHLTEIENALIDLDQENLNVALVLPDDTLQWLADWTGEY